MISPSTAAHCPVVEPFPGNSSANVGNLAPLPCLVDLLAVGSVAVLDLRPDVGQCAAVDGEIMCYQNMHEAEEVERMMDIDVVTAMSSSADPDTMYYHEAMKQPDRKQFVEAVKKEFGTMVDNGLVEIVPKSEMPEGANLFPAVWAMKRKRRVLTHSNRSLVSAPAIAVSIPIGPPERMSHHSPDPLIASTHLGSSGPYTCRLRL